MKNWDYKVGHGGVASIRWRGTEVVQRIFVTVRDKVWREIAPTSWHSEAEEDRDATSKVRLYARHQSNDVDFEWSGTFGCGPEEGILCFTFAGRAHRDMELCRVGLVVLHPVEPHLGGCVDVAGPGGKQTFRLEERIHPQRIVDGVPQAICEPFRQLSMELPVLGKICFAFDGDLFEMEDQRNWGDLSFKTYCTPLRLGFPRKVLAGSTVRHNVDIRLEVASNAPTKVRAARQCACFPEIGRQISVSERAPHAVEAAIPWRYVGLKVESDSEAVAAAAVIAALPPDARLELHVTEGSHEQITAIFRTLLQSASRVARVLVYGAGIQPPDPAFIAYVRQRLARWRISKHSIVAAARGYFVEFNRAAPYDAEVDGIALPLTATVHADDPWTIATNVAAVESIAATARELCAVDHVQLAPLALYHPAHKQQQPFSQELVAPWLVATLAHAATAGISAVTLGQDVIDAMVGSQRAENVELLRLLASLSGRRLVPLEAPAAPGIHVLAVQRDACTADLLIANLNEEATDMSLGKGIELADLLDAGGLEWSDGCLQAAAHSCVLPACACLIGQVKLR